MTVITCNELLDRKGHQESAFCPMHVIAPKSEVMAAAMSRQLGLLCPLHVIAPKSEVRAPAMSSQLGIQMGLCTLICKR